jgi:hypothetical protein
MIQEKLQAMKIVYKGHPGGLKSSFVAKLKAAPDCDSLFF